MSRAGPRSPPTPTGPAASVVETGCAASRFASRAGPPRWSLRSLAAGRSWANSAPEARRAGAYSRRAVSSRPSVSRPQATRWPPTGPKPGRQPCAAPRAPYVARPSVADLPCTGPPEQERPRIPTRTPAGLGSRSGSAARSSGSHSRGTRDSHGSRSSRGRPDTSTRGSSSGCAIRTRTSRSRTRDRRRTRGSRRGRARRTRGCSRRGSAIRSRRRSPAPTGSPAAGSGVWSSRTGRSSRRGSRPGTSGTEVRSSRIPCTNRRSSGRSPRPRRTLQPPGRGFAREGRWTGR